MDIINCGYRLKTLKLSHVKVLYFCNSILKLNQANDYLNNQLFLPTTSVDKPIMSPHNLPTYTSHQSQDSNPYTFAGLAEDATTAASDHARVDAPQTRSRGGRQGQVNIEPSLTTLA